MSSEFGKVFPKESFGFVDSDDEPARQWPIVDISRTLLSLNEYMMNGQKWLQVPYLIAQSIIIAQENQVKSWEELLRWAKNLSYNVILKQTERTPVLELLGSKMQADFIGPHRYDPEIPILQQRERAVAEGIQCQVLVHAVLEHVHGVRLPKDALSAELFSDELTTSIVGDLGEVDWLPGDIAFFHSKPSVDSRALHMALYVGSDLAVMPWLIHATHYKDENRQVVDIWPLSRFLSNPSFQFIYDVRRLLDSQEEIANMV